MHARTVLTLLIAMVLSVPGCGPPTATVKGEVTVDGKALEKGLIVFSPADDNGVPARAKIKDGHYEVTLIAGKKFVQISAPVVVAKRKESDAPDAATVEITEESLPERYTNGVDLTFDAAPGNHTKNWSAESKPKQ